MYGYIYETTCIPTGKKYIGMHKWSKNTIDSNYFGSGIALKIAIEKYGKENFSCKVIEWCKTRNELLEKEAYYISKYKAPINENYYNIADGGCGGHSEYYTQPVTQHQLDCLEYGRHLPASSRLKQTLSELFTGREVSNETREKLRQAQLGKKCINNGVENKFINKNELSSYLESGWEMGQLPKDRTFQIEKFKNTHYNKDKANLEDWKNKIRDSVKGRRWVTDGKIDKLIKQDDLEYYLSIGFYLGRSHA